MVRTINPKKTWKGGLFMSKASAVAKPSCTGSIFAVSPMLLMAKPLQVRSVRPAQAETWHALTLLYQSTSFWNMHSSAPMHILQEHISWTDCVAWLDLVAWPSWKEYRLREAASLIEDRRAWWDHLLRCLGVGCILRVSWNNRNACLSEAGWERWGPWGWWPAVRPRKRWNQFYLRLTDS